MPKRTDIASILLIGSGPIVIGQACEFDYSGSQAARALMEEDYRVILVNSNPATIMTDPMMADEIYLRELTPSSIAQIAREEQPDAVLPTMGGQTGLNVAQDLKESGFWEEEGIEVIGVDIDTVQITEDRQQFRDLMDDIGLDQSRSRTAKSLLEAKEIDPLQASTPAPVNVRVIAATDTDLEKAVQEGRFRQDLYHRLSMAPLNIPPLRDRPEDIPALVQTFIMMYNRGVKFGVQGFSTQAMHALQSYSWPGNVRELENLVQRMCILHCNQTVHVEDLPPKYRGSRRSDRPVTSASSIHDPANLDFYARMSQLEDQLILNALQQAKGNKKQAAQILNMKRTTLLEKIKKKKLGPALQDMMKKNASSASDSSHVISNRGNSAPVSS